ncbi:ATP synthase subunit g, mitochondrial-like [Cebus imitator]|uniref:ATP synthase subunit g, mitochondrial-like n=1 Tax=Cebus imitator TaxID=2715852 RepID=UPI001897ED9B|nr:ATP synthase subunit g, mitochondrial-like [Cebus imitator]
MAQFIGNLVEKTPVLVNAAVTYSQPQLATFWYYAKIELIPPTPAEIPRAIQSLKKIVNSAQTGSFKQLTVEGAVLNGLVATEVLMWFYVAEIIGKRGITGYDVQRPIFNIWLYLIYYLSVVGTCVDLSSLRPALRNHMLYVPTPGRDPAGTPAPTPPQYNSNRKLGQDYR